MILIPKYRDIIVPIHIKQSRLCGRWVLEARKADGRIRKLAEFPNLITTNGGNLYATQTANISTGCVGSGSNPPSLGDTALQTLVASTTGLGPASETQSASGTGGPTYWGQFTVQYAWPIGGATGNLSEIGVGNATNNLFSRALILDGGGSPTTITVLSSEALYATYSYQQYAPTADVTGNVTIAGTNYAYTLRAADAGSALPWAPGGCGFANNSGAINQGIAYNGAIGVLTALPAGTSSTFDSSAMNSYSAGTFTLTGTVTWGLAKANFGGGGVTAVYVQFGSHGGYQIGLSPGIPKDASHVLTLDVGHSWALNTP